MAQVEASTAIVLAFATGGVGFLFKLAYDGVKHRGNGNGKPDRNGLENRFSKHTEIVQYKDTCEATHVGLNREVKDIKTAQSDLQRKAEDTQLDVAAIKVQGVKILGEIKLLSERRKERRDQDV